jgi:hypothetical protein
MSDAIRAAVAAKLETLGITFAVRYVGATKRDDWECDVWAVTFTRAARVLQSGHNMPAVSLAESYFTGLGHRTLTALAQMHLRKFKPGSIGYRNELRALGDTAYKINAPHAADVLYSLSLDGMACETSFSDWCADLGMDSDSIKALNTYQACERIGHGLRALLSQHELAEIREALADY